jgi:hypothetical protein
MGGVTPGAGAQGTKDGPLGVGPMPVLSEPLGSSIQTTVAQDCHAADSASFNRLSTGAERRQPLSTELLICRRIRIFIRNLTA